MAAAALTRHRTVLERCESTTDFERRFGVEFKHDATFATARAASTGLVLEYGKWVDMGKPATVTVAVVPGDELTSEAEAELEVTRAHDLAEIERTRRHDDAERARTRAFDEEAARG